MESSTTESSDSFQEVSIELSFSACGTVRGKPSRTKLDNISHDKREARGVCESGGVRLQGTSKSLPVLASPVVLELVADHAHHDVV